MKTTIEEITDLDPARNDDAFVRMLNEVRSSKMQRCLEHAMMRS